MLIKVAMSEYLERFGSFGGFRVKLNFNYSVGFTMSFAIAECLKEKLEYLLNYF